MHALSHTHTIARALNHPPRALALAMALDRQYVIYKFWLFETRQRDDVDEFLFGRWCNTGYGDKTKTPNPTPKKTTENCAVCGDTVWAAKMNDTLREYINLFVVSKKSSFARLTGNE